MDVQPVTVVVSQPVDTIGSVLVPAVAILVSAGIALSIAYAERRAAERSRKNAQVANLIRALSEVGYIELMRNSAEAYDAAWVRFEQELNALAVLISKKEIAVLKYISEVIDLADKRDEDGPTKRRVAFWCATALELWARGRLRPKDFADNLPNAGLAWIETIDLGQWDALVRGESITGFRDVA